MASSVEKMDRLVLLNYRERDSHTSDFVVNVTKVK